MYCHHCGKELPDQVRFCPNCGAPQSGQTAQMKPGNSKGLILGVGFMILALIVLAIVCLALLIGRNTPANRMPEEAAIAAAATTVVTVPEPTAEATLPQQGWYQEDGKTYYMKDGAPLTGFQEIRDDYYYFYEDGVMAVNTRVEYGDDTLELDSNGHLAGVVFAYLSNDWADESYHFGNGGSAAVIEFDSTVEDCRSLTFYLRASGNYGSHCNGSWKVLIKSHGKWEHVKDISYQEPEGYFTIKFDTPTSFDAMTAYPTVQGNASYGVFFDVYDVYCRP